MSPDPVPVDQAPPSGSLFFRVFPSLMLPMFLGVVDQTIVATALPAISADLGDVERISWVVVAYLISNTIAAPVYGRMGDVLGRKKMLFMALGVMTVASLLCAVAPTMLTLTAARALQGLGGSGLMTLAHSLVGEVVPPRERARYQGYIAAVVVCSNSFGPLAGGFLTEIFGWRSVFFINLPLGLAAAIIARRLPTAPRSGGAWSFDGYGLVYFVSFVLPALLALEQIQHLNWSTAPLVGGLVALSIGGLFLLLRRESREPQPLIPIALLRKATIWRSGALSASHGAALVSLITFVPIYLRVVRGTSASETGLLLLPIAVGIGIGSLSTGRLVSKIGRTMIFPSVGLVLAAILMVGFALWLSVLSLPKIAILLGVLAFFMGSVMGVVQVTVQNAAGSSMLGAAAGSVNFSRSVGAAFGTTIVSTLLFSLLSSKDPRAAQFFAALVEQGPAVLDHVAPALRRAVLETVDASFRIVFLLIAAYVALGAILAWSVPSRRLP
ncbi:MDR family MFS transporter [Telmatospirillum sp.]|uniref:MDR family MFS transporter n=1 Tax=Telmatospirillum sp. TaxID=2079197 RepID=UPI00283E6C78|nr:MDR family MFS transporter [Telmatospirillum sp.]MDR3436117.1 MDR family MFS transporter [Telmatospirillum sp.]